MNSNRQPKNGTLYQWQNSTARLATLALILLLVIVSLTPRAQAQGPAIAPTPVVRDQPGGTTPDT
ncbi:MAG: hypothetical protein D6796_12060, partial [Caldilineae bacterium]